MTAAATELELLSAPELLGWAIREHGQRFALVTSFQREGMVLLDMAVKLSPSVRVITLDTGRLPPETFDIIKRVYERYNIRVEITLPDAQETSRMVTTFGPNLFLESVGHRRLCCE